MYTRTLKLFKSKLFEVNLTITASETFEYHSLPWMFVWLQLSHKIAAVCIFFARASLRLKLLSAVPVPVPISVGQRVFTCNCIYCCSDWRLPIFMYLAASCRLFSPAINPIYNKVFTQTLGFIGESLTFYCWRDLFYGNFWYVGRR